MAGKPREDRTSVKTHFIAVRLADHEYEALQTYRERQDVLVSPAEILRTALRVFLGERLGNPKPMRRRSAPNQQPRSNVTHLRRAPKKTEKK